MEQEYIQDELSSLFIHVHAPRLFGNTLVSMTLVLWQLARQVTTYIPLNLVSSKAWITTFCSKLHRQDKLLLWCESPPIQLVSLCTLSYFWCPWVGSTQRRRILKIWFGSGSCDGSWPSLKLPSLVVPGGKCLPFSPVSGIPTSEREPCWWHINGVPNNVTRTQLTQTKWFVLFLARALCHHWMTKSRVSVHSHYFMSMAAKLSDLGNRTSGANPQMEGFMDVPSQSAKDLWELEASGSSPSHLHSWSLARRPLSSWPNMKHCLEIHVMLTEELGAVPPPSHSWTAPLVEDMLLDIRTGLTKAVVTGLSRAVLFYGKHSLGEGLTADEARDATFLLTGTGLWVGKLAYHTANPMTIQKGWWAITQAVTDFQVKARGLGHPHVNPLAQQPFRFDCLRGCPIKNTSGDVGSDCQSSPYWPPRGWDCNRHWRDHRPPSPWFPLPSLDHGFEGDWSSLSMASSMSSHSDRWDWSQHSWWGRWHREDGACMKINLPVFKDEDAKDVVTYQSWRWDLMVYQHAGCRYCTLLPYAIQSLQGYPGELVQSSGMIITLDDVLTILDKHYNNMKALDALNQELF